MSLQRSSSSSPTKTTRTDNDTHAAGEGEGNAELQSTVDAQGKEIEHLQTLIAQLERDLEVLDSKTSSQHKAIEKVCTAVHAL